MDDESSESESSECSCGEINSRHCRVHGADELVSDQPLVLEDERDADIVIPSKSLLNGRPRDEVWDELERLFGAVVDKTSAHGARNRAVKDLRAYGASAELVRLAARRWTSLYPSANLTDSAIAKHWPQLTAGARQRTGLPACAECGMGGGLHVADCPTVQAPGDLERFLNDEDEEVA